MLHFDLILIKSTWLILIKWHLSPGSKQVTFVLYPAFASKNGKALNGTGGDENFHLSAWDLSHLFLIDWHLKTLQNLVKLTELYFMWKEEQVYSMVFKVALEIHLGNNCRGDYFRAIYILSLQFLILISRQNHSLQTRDITCTC